MGPAKAEMEDRDPRELWTPDPPKPNGKTKKNKENGEDLEEGEIREQNQPRKDQSKAKNAQKEAKNAHEKEKGKQPTQMELHGSSDDSSDQIQESQMAQAFLSTIQ